MYLIQIIMIVTDLLVPGVNVGVRLPRSREQLIIARMCVRVLCDIITNLPSCKGTV